MSTSGMDRRGFLKVAGVAASSVLAAAACAPVELPPLIRQPYEIPRRVLGKTGQQLSVVGFGGIVVMNETPESAAQLVAQAIERDVNYFDVAPSYGNAEQRLGPALEPYRNQVFLACKTQMRTRKSAEYELKRSLEHMRTDHFDLYQHHAVTTLAEVEQIFGPDGAMAAFLDARDKGSVRHIGFSAHSEQAALAMLGRFQFDSVLYPVNWVCWNAGNFGPAVVAKAKEQGTGILALKSLALEQGKSPDYPKCWYKPVTTSEDAATGLRFTLSRPVTAAVCPSHAELLWWMCDAAENLTPLTEQEEALLAEKSAEYTPIFTA